MHIKQSFLALALIGALPLFSANLTACSQPIAQTTNPEATSEAPSEATTEATADTPEVMAATPHDMADMDLGPKDENFDLRFIDGMILHHQGAIAMAEAVLANSSRDDMKQLAQAIIAAQQQEIEQMQQWRQAWYPAASDTPMMYHAEMNHMMPMTEEMQAAMMMNVDLGAADEQFDLRFLNAMIPHHEGALVMAQQVLERSSRPELLALAQNIIATQQQEIDQMQQWRQAWYGQ